jgi:hypothetical protein
MDLLVGRVKNSGFEVAKPRKVRQRGRNSDLRTRFGFVDPANAFRFGAD